MTEDAPVLDDLEAEAPWGDDEEEVIRSDLPMAARMALVKLLTTRFVTNKEKGTWNALLSYEDEIRERLADMFLVLVLDTRLGVAFKRQNPRAEGLKLLRQSQGHELSADASFLLVWLRKECSFSDGEVQVTEKEVMEFLRPFRPDGDGDQAGLAGRARTAINALVGLRLLSPVGGDDFLFEVSPVIEALVGVDEIERFRRYYTGQTASAPPTPTEDEGEVQDAGVDEGNH